MLHVTVQQFGDQESDISITQSNSRGQSSLPNRVPSYANIQEPLVIQMQTHIPTPLMVTTCIFTDKQLLIQFILDPTHTNIKAQIQIQKDVMQKLEKLSRLMCPRIHYR